MDHLHFPETQAPLLKRNHLLSSWTWKLLLSPFKNIHGLLKTKWFVNSPQITNDCVWVHGLLFLVT